MLDSLFSVVGKNNLRFALKKSNISIFKTIRFNFIAFPFSQAIKFPFLIGRHVEIRGIGKILVKCPIEPCAFTIGVLFNSGWESKKESRTVFYNEGVLELNGYWSAYSGSKIYIKNNACLSFMGYNLIGNKSKIICYNNIKFGSDTNLSWECEVMDSNFHNLKDLVSGKIQKREAPIEIGNGVFFFNNVRINKGTEI